MSVLALLSCARADLRFDAETGAFYNSNLSNSDRASDEKDDWAWKTDVRASEGFQLARDLRLNLGADLHGEVWNQYDAFDQIDGGVSAGLRYRFGLGREAPWILLEDRIGYDNLRESAMSGWDETLRLRGGFSITERIALEGGYQFQDFCGRDDFFTLQSHRVDTRLIVDLTSALQIALGYSYRSGDIVAYAVPPRPEIAAIAVERELVSTFGTDPRYTAYRLNADTHAVSLSASYTFTKFFSVLVNYEYASTSRASLRYENHLFAAKVAFAY